MRKLGIIGVPSSAGARRTGQEQAPEAFRRTGLVTKLEAAGLEVIDYGDLAEVRFSPDQDNPKAQNLPLVVDVANRVATQVEAARRDSAVPVILGGDCSIALGAVAGFIAQTPNLGLMYFDGDLDLNTPETTPSGIFDGMVMAHLTGNGLDELTRIGSRYPLMAEEDIVLFGFNTAAGAIDPIEVERLQECRMAKYPVDQIRGHAQESAGEALGQLESKCDSILVHFDVDVIDSKDFPAGDVLHPHGLSFADTMSALGVFAESPKFAGLVIAEFNVDRDKDGSLAERLVDAVVEILAVRV